MERAILLMGGNLGNTSELLKRAVERMAVCGCRVVSLSSELQTEPWGFEGAKESVPKFVNQAVCIETELEPEELLELTQRIELEVGRDREQEMVERVQRGAKYASRRIDIDIIFYGSRCYESDRLRIPHPLMQERDFVLLPLVEIAPEWRHPVLNCSCEELLNRLNDR